MSDLSEVLPDFDLTPYRHLTHSLEKNDVSVAELVSIDPIDIAKRCPLPLADLRAFTRDIIQALQADLRASRTADGEKAGSKILGRDENAGQGSIWKASFGYDSPLVRTLDPAVDECLGGGFRTGHVIEIVGESAVGKTQFVLGLLLSAQLKPPNGLGKSAFYLSTEAPLNTKRLNQMLLSHPVYEDLDPEECPSLDRIFTYKTNNLEDQETIISHRLPIAIPQCDIGLVVIDSVAANFRAEHETKDVKGLADRAADLGRLGNMLRKIAREHHVAVVVTNQVSDRFDDARTIQDRIRSSSPMVASSPRVIQHKMIPTQPSTAEEVMTLDHQQRFFTGWGDQPTMWYEQLKTPALGLTWANQLSARIVLKMESERMGQQRHLAHIGGNIWNDVKKRRYVGVVFAPWVAPTLDLVSYEIATHGITSISQSIAADENDLVDKDMLDPSLWFDGPADGEEFP